MQCNFLVDSNGAGAIPRMDKNAAIIGKFTLTVYSIVHLSISFFLSLTMMRGSNSHRNTLVME